MKSNTASIDFIVSEARGPARRNKGKDRKCAAADSKSGDGCSLSKLAFTADLGPKTSLEMTFSGPSIKSRIKLNRSLKLKSIAFTCLQHNFLVGWLSRTSLLAMRS